MTELEEMVARLSILNLEGEYARTWDVADADGWASLFTEEGVFEMTAVGERAAARFEGRAALTKFCRNINARYEGLHLMHVPSLSVDADEARGWMHFEFRARHGGELLHVAGIYDVHYRKQADGWRIHHRLEQAVQDGLEFYGIPRSLAESP